jgi:tRNA A-37 threonylcarbamoyl transferase component Bud32
LKDEQANLDKAIERLHELNVVHNDLKWDNVIFTEDDNNNNNGAQVVIIDYGFSQLKASNTRVSYEDERINHLT